jgi:DNA-binding XRE family transcriptional regulator
VALKQAGPHVRLVISGTAVPLRCHPPRRSMLDFRMPSGRKPDLKQRDQMLRLRASGLSLTQVGKRLGVSRQRAHAVLSKSGKLRLVPIRCRQCSHVLTHFQGVYDNNSPVYCTGCLPRDAALGQRLKTSRLSAGLTLAELERRSGVGRMLISSYECGRSEPAWQSLAKLIRVLGVDWLDVR